MFTITATDRHGVTYRGRIRRLVPRECLRLRAFMTGRLTAVEQETSDSQLYKQAGNGVTVNVIEAIGTLLGRQIQRSGQRMKRQRGKAVWQLEFRINISVQRLR